LHLASRTVAAVIAVLAWSLPAAAQSWEELQARDTIIAAIDIVVTDVFDVTEPADNTWLGRAANAVHVQTRRRVVARELLFAVGDAVDVQRIHETERNLRRYSFIRDARIVPGSVSTEGVRARVEVFDAWSLDAGVDFSRTGGTTAWGVNVDEANFAGAGKRLAFAYERNRERSATELAYTDPQLLDSRWRLFARYANLSDGRSHAVSLERPFFSVETPYAVGAFVSAAEYSLTHYNLGDAVYVVPSTTHGAAVFASRAHLARDRTAVRVGAVFRASETDYGAVFALRPTPLPIPEASHRRFRGVSVTGSVVQDRPATFRNLVSIAHTEDYNLGWTLSSEAGYFAKSLGSITSASFGDIGARKGWKAGSNSLVLVDAGFGGRHESGKWQNAVTSGQVTLYNRNLKWQTLAANVRMISVVRPDPESWLYLDSTAGMRGYVDHFLAGDRRAIFSFDDRIITDWQLLGLLQIGFVGYVDVGAVRRFDTGRWSRTFANVGGGLRFGSLKGSRGNVIQASIAVPLVREPGMDRVLLVLGNTVRF